MTYNRSSAVRTFPRDLAAMDQAFLEMMIKHHQGAVAMAKTEQVQGCPPCRGSR